MRNKIPETYTEIENIADIQAILTFILKRFHDICCKNGLFYNVFGGTMLGAIRHRGFIPWDDDIDVVMPFSDYDKLEEVLKNDEELIVKKPGDRGYAYPFIKICLRKTVLMEKLISRYSMIGAYIDVFPVGGYPQKDEDWFFKRLASLKKKRGLAVSKIHPSKIWWKKLFFPVRLLQAFPYRITGAERIEKKEESLLRSCSTEGNGFLLLQGAGWGKKGKIEKDIFFERVLYRFGDLNVYGIKEYDEHLKRLYGDYMTLPPEEKRVSNHSYRLYIDGTLLKRIKGGDSI